MKFAEYINLSNAIHAFLNISLMYVSKFDEILLNFNEYCPKSVFALFAAHNVLFCSLKIVRVLTVFLFMVFCGAQH